jgi:hypothetical protein
MKSGPHERLRRAIAEDAARRMIESGEDVDTAKRKAAAARLGARTRAAGPLPDDEQVHAAVRERQRIFAGATHRERLDQLRRRALAWMERLAPFQPHLVGAVLDGSATPHSGIELHLFADSAKDVELALMEARVDFRVDAGLSSVQLERIALLDGAGRDATRVLVSVFDPKALRRPPAGARAGGEPAAHPVELSGRADAPMLRQMLEDLAGAGSAEGALA